MKLMIRSKFLLIVVYTVCVKGLGHRKTEINSTPRYGFKQNIQHY